MSYGLLGIGQQQADQAMAGFDSVAKLENARVEQGESIKAQKEAQSQQMKGTLAGTGAIVGGMAASSMGLTGMAALGPVGIGAAVGGLILGSLF